MAKIREIFDRMSIKRGSKKHIGDSDFNISGSTSTHCFNSSDTGELSRQTALALNSDMSSRMYGSLRGFSMRKSKKESKKHIGDSDFNISGSTSTHCFNSSDTGELSRQTALALNSDMSSRMYGSLRGFSMRKSKKESKKHIGDLDFNVSSSTSIHSFNSSDTGEQFNNRQTTKDLNVNMTPEPPSKPKKTEAEAMVEDIGKLIDRLVTYENYAIDNNKNEIEQSIIFYQAACSVIGELGVKYFHDTLSDDRIEELIKALGSNLEQVKLLVDSEKVQKACNYILARLEGRLKGFWFEEISSLNGTENCILESFVTKVLLTLQGKSIDSSKSMYSSKVIETIMEFLDKNLQILKKVTNPREDLRTMVERFEKIVNKTNESLNSKNCPVITKGSILSGLSEEEREAVSNAADKSAKNLIQRIEQRTIEDKIIVFIKDIIDVVTTVQLFDNKKELITSKIKVIPQEQSSTIYAVLKPYLAKFILNNSKICEKLIKEIVSFEIGKLGEFIDSKLVAQEKATKLLVDKIVNIQEDPSVEPETTSDSTDGLETIAEITNFIESAGMLTKTAVNLSSITEYVPIKTRVEAGIDRPVKIARQFIDKKFLRSLAEELKWEDGAVVDDMSPTSKVGGTQLLQHEPKYGIQDNTELLENPLISEDGLYRHFGAYSASPDDYEVGTMGNSVPDDCINFVSH